MERIEDYLSCFDIGAAGHSLFDEGEQSPVLTSHRRRFSGGVYIQKYLEDLKHPV